MSQTYLFDIATQTSNGEVNPDILASQLIAAAYPSGGVFEGVSLLGGEARARGLFLPPGTIVIQWQNALSAADQTAQIALVAAHVGEQFARQFQRRAALPLQTNATNTYESAFAGSGGPLVVDPVASGLWRISFYCEIRLQDPPAGVQRVELQIVDEPGSPIVNASWIDDDWMPISGSRVFDKETGSRFEVDMLWRRVGVNAVADIRRCQVVVEMVRANE